jgi:hypothetical protein
MPSTSAISAAVIRRRRSASITFTRSAGNCVGLLLGAELRSARPATPSARQRALHLAAVRSLTPAASAAAVSDQLSSSMRLTSRRRLFGQVRALRMKVKSPLRSFLLLQQFLAAPVTIELKRRLWG